MRPLRPEQHPAVRQQFEVQQREARRRLLERRSGAWNFKQDREEDEAGEKRVSSTVSVEIYVLTQLAGVRGNGRGKSLRALQADGPFETGVSANPKLKSHDNRERRARP